MPLALISQIEILNEISLNFYKLDHFTVAKHSTLQPYAIKYGCKKCCATYWPFVLSSKSCKQEHFKVAKQSSLLPSVLKYSRKSVILLALGINITNANLYEIRLLNCDKTL